MSIARGNESGLHAARKCQPRSPPSFGDLTRFQTLFGFVFAAVRLEMRGDAFEVVVRKLGVAIETEEIRLPGEGLGRALAPEEIE
jgi:hypothetical protein